jgi:hypothetical protein
MKGASRLQHARGGCLVRCADTGGASPRRLFPAVFVKWGKDSFDVDVDPSLPGAVFKTQMFTLTGVPPERQKFTGIKNPPLKVLLLLHVRTPRGCTAPHGGRAAHSYTLHPCAAEQDDADMSTYGLKEVR